MHSEIEVLEQQLPPRERAWWRLARYTGWTLVAIYFAAALGVLGLRFLVLPNVHRYTDAIAEGASRLLGERVEIGKVEAEWFGLHPRLELSQVRVIDRQGREALRLPYVGVTVAWRSLLYGRPLLRSLVVDGADLDVRRNAAGRLFVAGLEVKSGGAGGRGLAEAVLDMRELMVRDATLVWVDEQRGAPPLRLSDLQFMLENDGRRHRFALAADPPRDHASALDVRGEVMGRGTAQLEEWDGRLYAAFDFIDLAVWNAWIDLPLAVKTGRGALRLWATLRDWRPTEALADLGLADVSVRLARDLPPLEVKWVEGRLGAREVPQSAGFMGLGTPRAQAYEAFGTRLGLETTAGARFEPSDFQARWQPAAGDAAPQGSFTASSIDLAPLARIGESVPLPPEVRRTLAELSPEGRLEDVRVQWTGAVDAPRTYSARARFGGLGMQPWRKAPGFARLAGNVEVSEKGGSATIDATDVTLDYPAVFITPRHQFDSLNAKLAWTLAAGGVDMRIDNVSLTNADVDAVVSGSYRTEPGSPGHIDLVARVPRAEGAAVHRYMPLTAPNTTAWLKRALVAAQGSEGRVRLKGNLADYPFDAPKSGVFEVAVKVANGTLDVAEGWPRITGIQGEYGMSGRSLSVKVNRAASLGVQLGPVNAVIPDLFALPTPLKLEGTAEGPAAEFLRFVQASPVNRLTGQMLEGWTATGNGQLALSADMPLEELEKSRIRGSFQLANNTVTPGVAGATLAQVNGRIEFTESGVSARGITGLWQGGPLSFDVISRGGATSVSGQATLNVPATLAQFGVPLAKRVSGSTAVRFSMSTRGGQVTQLVESSLQDVAIDLPPPFAKPAAEAWPLRIERTFAAGAAQQLVDVSLAKVLNARAQLRPDGAGLAVERAGIGVGDVGVALPDRPGVFVSVNLRRIDLDRFLALQGDAGEGTPAFQVAALSIRAPEVIVGGKLFHDVQARALQAQPARWQVAVNAREVTGDVSYSSDGKGAVVAKLKQFVHPESEPGVGDAGGRTLDSLPAIELDAESYVFNGRALGRLEARAVNERLGWRVETLRVASPDCRLAANGLWQPAAGDAPPRTSFKFDIDAADGGRCLARLGYPEALTGGATRLEGEAEWRGPVYAIDYPSLAGKLAIEVDKGQFMKVNPGIGKLLGVLSLQSLPRRVTLDFRDVFSEGFAFDSIRGTAVIRAGVIRTEDLAMVGPAATVSMRGEADLARETQDLTVRVVPVIGDSVAAAAGVALLNPIIGAGALLAQRILKDPIGQMFAFEYRVSGGWDDPKVERLAARGAPEAEAPR
jgi:uncharacterized protein (TIGR02099 family)